MQTLPIRLDPGQDLRAAIEGVVRGSNCRAAFVISGIGSLFRAILGFAGAGQPRRFSGDTEILSLASSISFDGTHSSLHIHMALSMASGEGFLAAMWRRAELSEPRGKSCWRGCRAASSRVRRMC